MAASGAQSSVLLTLGIGFARHLRRQSSAGSNRRHHPLGRLKVTLPVVVVEVIDTHMGAASGGVDEAVIAQVDRYMVNRAAMNAKEQQVTGLKVSTFHRGRIQPGQRARGAGQLKVIQGFEHIMHQPAAIEALSGAGAAPSVRCAQGGQGAVDDLLRRRGISRAA